MKKEIGMQYYVCRKLQNGAYDYVCAPKGWRYTSQIGAIKEEHFRGGPEMSFNSDKRFIFNNKKHAQQQAAMISDSIIVPC